MLALKLCLVPAFLLAISLAGKRWGPSMAGWLAGLPVVTGPILFFLAMEHGAGFASSAAAASLSAVFASVSFSLAYAHAARRVGWPSALAAALAAWALAAWCLSTVPASPWYALAIAILTLAAAPRLFPAARAATEPRPFRAVELACRMAAGAMLTVGVTWVSGSAGQGWSGLLAVFPVLGIVLAVFSHRSQGAGYAAALLRAMAAGLSSFVAFCFALSVALPVWGLPGAFAAATAAALVFQLASLRSLRRLPVPVPRSVLP